MADINEQILNLKSTVFGSDDFSKAYSLRLPLDLTAHVEAIAEVSGKSRNVILIDILKLGLTCFTDHLDNVERAEIGEAYHQVKQELMIEMMENK
jgi:predicted DNA-binding protein